jgi:hypothetical protein
VIASGLAALYVARGSTDTSLLDQAEITLDATIAHLTVNNILKESCDNAAGTASCNHDQVRTFQRAVHALLAPNIFLQQVFKGIWTKHLQFYLDNAGASRVAKYSGFLGERLACPKYCLFVQLIPTLISQVRNRAPSFTTASVRTVR